jgi:hypothetical protein
VHQFGHAARIVEMAQHVHNFASFHSNSLCFTLV